MDVFSLDNWVLKQYTAFARSFTRIRSSELQTKVNALYEGRKFWPEPLIQLNPHYEEGGTIASLVEGGGLSKECAEIFRDSRASAKTPDKSLRLRRHQEQAIGLALNGKSYVVTTGTGSGKSLCFFIPIVDAIIKAKLVGETPKTRAIIIYPMNALANSQQEELKKFLFTSNSRVPVTFARYTGQETQEEREKIKNNPPDILLTNFMMLELLMTRQADLDQRVIENCRGLKFIVLDELHTYRGRQGADVAMLMRRLRARVGDPVSPPICIGTSATMANEGEEADQNQIVADVASRLFGTKISRDAIVTETLKRVTDIRRSADHGLVDLGSSIARADTSIPYDGVSNAEIAQDPLAIWVETRLGLKCVESKPRRASPQSLKEAAETLAKDSGVALDVCERALKAALLAFSLSEKERHVPSGSDEPFFAFKLHQFISGAGRLYSTLDVSGSRTVTFDGQIFDPEHPEKRLYATHFCRRCGQEHHPVILKKSEDGQRFEKREIDDVPINDEEDSDDPTGRWGFLMPEPVEGSFEFQGRDEDYPDAWLEESRSGELRLKPSYRKTRAEMMVVRPDGSCGIDGRHAWFLPGRFKFCPACGDYHSDSTRDINRLASLSAEGRSSATTIIIAAILRWMRAPDAGIAPITQKLLAFTDNRQDAALQAGHFNDFIFVTLLRGAVLAALSGAQNEGLREDEIGQAVQRTLGFTSTNSDRKNEWLIEPDLRGANLLGAERTLREGLTHRFWIDQRRGWRYTNPNLEQLGLVEAHYLSLDEMVVEDSFFSGSRILSAATPEERKKAAKILFDTMRRGLAVECDALDRLKVESLAGRMRSLIKSPWCLDDERFLSASVFMPQPPSRNDMHQKDEVLILRGSSQSLVGRELKKMSFSGAHPSSQEVIEIIETLLRAAKKQGIAAQVASPVGGEGWRLVASSIGFKTTALNGNTEHKNPFFRELYEEIAQLLEIGGGALFGLEGREHTAQVDSDLRELREARFRFSSDDQKSLTEKADRLKELREDNRFLPTLFCSPTMELGVDISAMNVVYMRNVPPTPANYAQRSGRAGRSGQAALVVAYCAAQSPHDQYFFEQPKAMVDGVVKPPSIDLTNPDLVASHLHAEWLAASGLELDRAISRNLDMTSPSKPLLADIWSRISSQETVSSAEQRVNAVLSALERDYGDAFPDWLIDAKQHAKTIISNAPDIFACAFDRWRDLLRAAERQVDDATRTLQDYSISPIERRAAEGRQAAGNTQIKLLLHGAENQGSDFYVYRYLATEGFLPGYNFPRLPLMAFVPGGQGGKGQRYLQRARFLAIAEFGPGSLVYHEGRAYRVDRALLKEAGGGPDGLLPTFSTAVCPTCGASHDGEPPEKCHVCGHPLNGSNIIRELHKIENVGTKQVERITANDEDRRRQGFDLQTTFSFQQVSGNLTRSVRDEVGEILTAIFAPAALVRRINKGLRRRKDESEIGFCIDPKSGYWVGASSSQDNEERLPTNVRQRITPVVEDRKNALLLRFPENWLAEAGDDVNTVMATLQHALARGVEAVYQLEEGEILAEPTPNRKDRRALFFYEAAEGGAGALSRLMNDRNSFHAVARKALEIMHFDPNSFQIAASNGTDVLVAASGVRCVAGCYRCLLSYFNQPDHELIDRRNRVVQEILLRLAFSDNSLPVKSAAIVADVRGCPAPDAEPLTIGNTTISLVWRSARVAAIEEEDVLPELDGKISAKGIELVVLSKDEKKRKEAFAYIASVLGKKAS